MTQLIRKYMMGDCMYFAAAMYHLTGYDIVVLIDRLPCGEGYLDRCGHCYVSLPNGSYLDAAGVYQELPAIESCYFYQRASIETLEELADCDCQAETKQVIEATRILSLLLGNRATLSYLGIEALDCKCISLHPAPNLKEITWLCQK